MIMNRTLVSAALGFALACSYGAANASFTSCVGTGYNIADNVDPNVGCTILNPLDGAVNDSVDPPASSFTVNVEQFFGFSDWQFDGKWEEVNGTFVDGSSLYNFAGTPDPAVSGTFTYAGPVPPTVDNIMFVFKDGGDTNLVGYLITPGVNGTYTSPFEEPPFTFPGASPRDVSHISVYFRDGGGPPVLIPEPGSLALVGLGLMGLVAVARRRR